MTGCPVCFQFHQTHSFSSACAGPTKGAGRTLEPDIRELCYLAIAPCLMIHQIHSFSAEEKVYERQMQSEMSLPLYITQQNKRIAFRAVTEYLKPCLTKLLRHGSIS